MTTELRKYLSPTEKETLQITSYWGGEDGQRSIQFAIHERRELAGLNSDALQELKTALTSLVTGKTAGSRQYEAQSEIDPRASETLGLSGNPDDSPPVTLRIGSSEAQLTTTQTNDLINIIEARLDDDVKMSEFQFVAVDPTGDTTPTE